MVIDTSVLVAIVLGEPEEAKFLEAMRTSAHRLLSAVSLVFGSEPGRGRGRSYAARCSRY